MIGAQPMLTYTVLYTYLIILLCDTGMLKALWSSG